MSKTHTKRVLTIAIMAASILGLTSVASASYIAAIHSAKFLEVSGVAAGDQVIQLPYTGAAEQQFTFVAIGGGYYNIVSVASGLCLAVAGASNADGAPIIQEPCIGGNHQRFRLQPSTVGPYLIIARHSNKCMEVTGASMANGARIVQGRCHGARHQRFRISGL